MPGAEESCPSLSTLVGQTPSPRAHLTLKNFASQMRTPEALSVEVTCPKKPPVTVQGPSRSKSCISATVAGTLGASFHVLPK